MSAKTVDRLDWDSCTFCGVKLRKPQRGDEPHPDDTSREHVVPRTLLSRPLPDPGKTVPCCRGCNKGLDKDVEYFRDASMLMEDISESEDWQEIWGRVRRSLQRGRGAAHAMLRDSSHREMRTPAGLIIGNERVVKPEPKRLNRVAARVAEGLFAHHQRAALNPTHKMHSTWLGEGRIRQLWLQSDTLQAVAETAPQFAYGGVLKYRVSLVEDDPLTGMWVLLFFKRMLFVCTSLPLEDYDRGQRRRVFML